MLPFLLTFVFPVPANFTVIRAARILKKGPLHLCLCCKIYDCLSYLGHESTFCCRCCCLQKLRLAISSFKCIFFPYDISSVNAEQSGPKCVSCYSPHALSLSLSLFLSLSRERARALWLSAYEVPYHVQYLFIFSQFHQLKLSCS